ncbi:MAG: ABC transporter permease [Bryobacteraceae bacterium]|jgi:predicted permease
MTFFDDVRFGLRMWAHNPGFVAVAVSALALGIGANATVFAITNGVLFKGMPFDTNERILYLATQKKLARGVHQDGVSWPDFRDWRAQAKSFEGMAAALFLNANISDGNGPPEHYQAWQVTPNFFRTIGQNPVIGRGFNDADGEAGAAPVALLGYGVWETRYGRNPAIVGRIIRVNDTQTTVAGVMPKGLTFPNAADFWIPLIPSAVMEKREVRDLFAFGRMRAGVTKTGATVEMKTIARNLEKAYPATNEGVAPLVRTFSEENNGQDLVSLFIALMGAVAFVLLIACANVANLLLARAVTRSREISIRIALGAGRWRIVGQLLIESVMLSIAGGFLGWLIAIWGIRVFDKSVSGGLKPVWMDFSMDYRCFIYLAAVSLGAGLLFGLAPALRLSKLNVNDALKDGGRGSSGGGRRKFLAGLLVVSEMALAVVLLVGAGLMIRSFINVYQAPVGVVKSNVLVMRLMLPEAKYPKPEDQIDFHRRLRDRLSALPGVEAVTIASTMPTGGSMGFTFELEGAAPVDEERRPNLSALVIGLDYFRAMGRQVLRGRDFRETDGVSGPPVVLVNQRFAEKYWPEAEAVGKRLRLFDRSGPASKGWLTVTGVVPNILQNDVNIREVDPLIYLPYRQKPLRDMSIMARTTVPASTLGGAFRREVQAVDDHLPVYNLRTLEERLALNNWPYRIFGALFGIFAGIALVMASVGLYAVIANSVSQRTQEIGVRLALGASGGSVLKMIFAQGMRQLAIGLTLGLLLSLGVTRVLKSMLVQVSATDPATFFAVSLVLGAAAALGCWLPARRAMRVDPAIALRYE